MNVTGFSFGVLAYSSVVMCFKMLSSHGLYLSTNKTDRHDITEVLLKVALNTMHHTEVEQPLLI
jgi:hypothetical protein